MTETPPPYPLRTPEQATRLPDIFAIQPLPLTEQERQKLDKFEAALSEQLTAATALSPSIHSVFPKYFTTDQGWSQFQATYARTSPEVESWQKPATYEKAGNYFQKVQNLDQIPVPDRTAISIASLRYARGQFINQFANSTGDLNQVPDPIRLCRLINPQHLLQKASALRQLKREIKSQEGKLKAPRTPYHQAKLILLGLYRRYINTCLADLYDDAVVLANQTPTPLEREPILSAVKGLSPKHRPDRFALPHATRFLARVDRFLQGTGVRIGSDGNFEVLPQTVLEYISQDAATYHETPRYRQQSSHLVNGDEAKTMTETVLAAYGLLKTPDHPEGYEAVVDPHAINFDTVSGKIKIPLGLLKPLPEVIRLIAHEVEGHALRRATKDALDLHLFKAHSTGRSEAASEAFAVWVEQQTMQRAFGMPSVAGRRAYHIGLMERLKGGSFKDCFNSMLNYRHQILGSPQNEEVAKRELRNIFRDTLRLFRAGRIPLDDKSGQIVNSEELAYHEPTAAILHQKDLLPVLCLPGVDIYSLCDLQLLGAIRWEKIRTPRFVTASLIK